MTKRTKVAEMSPSDVAGTGAAVMESGADAQADPVTAEQQEPASDIIPGSGAVVILSGGQDSTTCLFWAKQRFETIHCITFNYGQRHEMEIRSAVRVANLAGVPISRHELLELPLKVLRGTSPLLQHQTKVSHYASAADLPGGVEPTFVPARNLLFLTLAANRAVVLGVQNIVLGVCQEDFGGYPDCRQDFIDKMQMAINAGIFGQDLDADDIVDDRTSPLIEIHTPLMDLTKAESVQLAKSLGDGCWNALAFSHTCYEGKYPPSPHNHASLLRAKGFRDAGYADPLIQRAKRENALPSDYPDDGLVEGTKYALKA